MKTVKRVFKPAIVSIKHRLSKTKIKRLLYEKEIIFLEAGAGAKKGSNEWTTLDLNDNCDIFWDLRNGLPFPNESISKIYSSHFLEHLTYKEGQGFLDECLRVLLPGGKFSICVPNAKLYIEAYLNSELDTNRYFAWKPACNNTTRIDYINYIAYMNGHHKYMFDDENLIHLLNSKGFKKVHSRGFDPSIDLEKRDYVSIYAEAEK